MIEVGDITVAEWNIPYKKGETLLASIEGCKFITVYKNWRVVTLIFNKDELHNSMYRKKFGGKGIVSAGFIRICSDTIMPVAEGKSTSIEGEPFATEDDTATIQAWYKIKLGDGNVL